MRCGFICGSTLVCVKLRKCCLSVDRRIIRDSSSLDRQVRPPDHTQLAAASGAPGDIWYLDEVVVKCAGEKFWLWRAVDQHGSVLEEILQKRRDKRAAKRLLVALMKRYGFAPKRIITDKLRSYGAAKAEVAPGLDHWSHKGLNNRAENSHLPFRKRERTMQGHRSQERCNGSSPCTQRPAIVSLFHLVAEPHTIRYHRLEAFDAWKIAACFA